MQAKPTYQLQPEGSKHYKRQRPAIGVRTPMNLKDRLKTHLPKLINNDQTGFIKGRFIGENIRLVDRVINDAATKNIPGLLLFLDFEMAFDTTKWSFIQKTLVFFGFGPSIIQWFDTFYGGSESCILNNGWASNLFPVHRGARQGWLWRSVTAKILKSQNTQYETRINIIKRSQIKRRSFT